MEAEPVWLTPDQVMAVTSILVAEAGHASGCRDPGLLESACSRPRQRWSYDGAVEIVDLASTLLFAAARNHPFLHGNKPTGLAAAILFLELNGYVDLSSDDPDELADGIVAVIDGRSSEAAFVAQWSRSVSRRSAA